MRDDAFALRYAGSYLEWANFFMDATVSQFLESDPRAYFS